MENAKLVLRTSDASSRSANNTNLMFANVDLRTVLGNMYDRYDKFILRLDYISHGINFAGDYGTTQEDETVNINISGLPFLNATYDYKTNVNKNYVTITALKFQNNPGISNVQYLTDTYVTFGKSQDTANINIFYTRQVNNVVPNTNNDYPQCVFNFSIFGIPNEYDKTLIIPTRMDNNKGKI
jgi:hypothetical protein